MKQVLGPGALGRPRGIRWRGRWEGGLGWGIHETPWLIHVNVWQNTLQCCEVISLQLIKINEKKKLKKKQNSHRILSSLHFASVLYCGSSASLQQSTDTSEGVCVNYQGRLQRALS